MTDTATIAKILGRTLTADEVALLNDFIIPAVNRYIETQIGGVYNDANGTLTLYRSGGTPVLYVGGLQDAAFTISYVDAEDNTDIIDPISYFRSGDYIFMREGNFTEGVRNIKIVGTYADIPVTLKLVAAHLAANVVDNQSSGEIQSESYMDYSVSYATTNVESGMTDNLADMLRPFIPIRLA